MLTSFAKKNHHRYLFWSFYGIWRWWQNPIFPDALWRIMHVTFTNKVTNKIIFFCHTKKCINLMSPLESIFTFFRGDTHMTSTLRGVGGKTKMICYRTLGGGGLANVLDVQSLFFFLIKKIGFAPWLDIMLSPPWLDIMIQTLMCYWQEIFLLVLMSGVKPSFNDTIALFVG